MTSVAKRDPEKRPPPRKSSSTKTAAAPAASNSAGADEFDTSTTQMADDDATQGEWLFKQNELVLGPVTAIVLVDKIKKGELPPDTPIARDGQPFRPMKLVPVFRDAWATAEEERRLAAEEKAHQAAVTRARVARVFVVLGLFAVPFAAAAAGGRALMIARPWDDSQAWIAKVPPLVDLPQKPPEKVEPKAEPKAETPSTVATANTPDDSADDDKDDKDPTKPKKKPKDKKDDGKADAKADGKSDAKADGKSDGKSDGKGDDGKSDDGKGDAKPAGGKLPETLTNAEAIAPLKQAQGAMKACFKAEMESNPDMPAQVVLSYTVTEDGKAVNIALDARELRGRPVVACVQKAIGALSWPKFSGERKNVSVPFKLGKPPAPKP